MRNYCAVSDDWHEGEKQRAGVKQLVLGRKSSQAYVPKGRGHTEIAARCIMVHTMKIRHRPVLQSFGVPDLVGEVVEPSAGSKGRQQRTPGTVRFEQNQQKNSVQKKLEQALVMF